MIFQFDSVSAAKEAVKDEMIYAKVPGWRGEFDYYVIYTDKSCEELTKDQVREILHYESLGV